MKTPSETLHTADCATAIKQVIENDSLRKNVWGIIFSYTDIDNLKSVIENLIIDHNYSINDFKESITTKETVIIQLLKKIYEQNHNPQIQKIIEEIEKKIFKLFPKEFLKQVDKIITDNEHISKIDTINHSLKNDNFKIDKPFVDSIIEICLKYKGLNHENYPNFHQKLTEIIKKIQPIIAEQSQSKNSQQSNIAQHLKEALKDLAQNKNLIPQELRTELLIFK